jgi:hypothetical protein
MSSSAASRLQIGADLGKENQRSLQRQQNVRLFDAFGVSTVFSLSGVSVFSFQFGRYERVSLVRVVEASPEPTPFQFAPTEPFPWLHAI